MAFVKYVICKKLKSATLVEVIVALVVLSSGFALAISILAKIGMGGNVLRKMSFIGKANQMFVQRDVSNQQNDNMLLKETSRGDLLKETTIKYLSDSVGKNYITKRRIIRK